MYSLLKLVYTQICDFANLHIVFFFLLCMESCSFSNPVPILSWRLITVILLSSADAFKKGWCKLQAKVCTQITG